MLQLTPAAAKHLEDLLASKGVPAQASIRIVRGPSGELQLRSYLPKSDDVGIEHQGKMILILDKEMSDLLNSRVLDVVPGPQGETLALTP
jgi:Fe-S cluster assembly iron-binding protein IscA